MLREYVNRFYLPACLAYENRSADQANKALQLCEWRESKKRNWNRLRFGTLEVHEKEDMYHSALPVHLKDLDPGAVTHQIYADAHEQGETEIYPMERGQRLTVTETAHVYTLSIPAPRPISDYTPRVIPFKEDAAVPLGSDVYFVVSVKEYGT